MNIIIVGGGVVGSTLAQQLEKEQSNHKITLIESDQEKCQKLTNKLDILTIQGSGVDPATLIKAGVDDADMIVAVTPSDETNILCCYLASRFNVPSRVARLKSTNYSHEFFGLKDLGVTDTIEPETDTINQILEYLYVPEQTEVINFRKAGIALRGFKVTLNCALANHSASEIASIMGDPHVLLLVISRNGETIIPNGESKILLGDEILLLMPISAISKFHDLFKTSGEKIPKVVINGESPMTIALVKEIEKRAKRTILISEDEEFCRMCANSLHNTDIFFGDPGQEETLIDAGVNTANFFISVDEDGEENVMTALLAKAEGAEQAIAVTNYEKHLQLFRTLGIDHIIQPTRLSTQQIFSDIAGFSRDAVFRHTKTDMDMSHFYIDSGNRNVGRSVYEIRQKAQSQFIIACILRNNEFKMVSGLTTIEEHDDIIVFYNSNDSKSISKLFKA